LTPVKVVLIYLLAFSLVSLHEAERLSSWAKELSWEWGVGALAAEPLQRFNTLVDKTGLPNLAEAESAWLGRMKFPVVGAISQAVFSGPDKGKNEPAIPVPESSLDGSPVPAVTSQVQVADTPLAMLGDMLESEVVAKPMVSGSWNGVREIGPSQQQSHPGNSIFEQTPITPNHVLIAGDSMMLEGFGVALERRLKGLKGLTVVRKGRYSSGLSRPDYFDWMPYLKELLDEHQPDLLVVSLGANDPQDIIDENGKRHYVATPEWNEQYAARARRFIGTAQEHGCFIFWVGLPIMGRTPYGERIDNLNQVVRGVCNESPSCTYVDTWLVLADSNGAYTTFMKNPQGKHIRIRAKDKIHLTEAGGEIMVDHFLEETKHYVHLPDVKDQPEQKKQLAGEIGRNHPKQPSPTPPSSSAGQ
jgi:hypothetical protein